ncbi:GNAT family N-acetyltransferase [Aureisphaera galaxeae]|uniref:GNAT family N-acetyltransferase n=1 Tax=Aureisphaera galaxeae TaxID=1538023 RepID=UPI0030104216
MKILPLTKEHFPEVAAIYQEGLDTGIATFETEVPGWETWNQKFLPVCRYVALANERVIGWCALSATSKRYVYRGVVEDTIYISEAARGQGLGRKLLEYLVRESEKEGFWTLQAAIFPQNKISIQLHEKCGFRIIGTREKVAKRDGIWHDNVLMERRSKKINYMKNILVLCTGNSCRSQMAHGYLNQIAGDKANIYSAGIETHGLNPGAVAIMKEDGIDITGHTSNHVDEYQGIAWDFIITVCDHANENCPFIPAPNAQRLHHNFFDPSKVEGTDEEKHTAFEKARNEIKDYCASFSEEFL